MCCKADLIHIKSVLKKISAFSNVLWAVYSSPRLVSPVNFKKQQMIRVNAVKPEERNEYEWTRKDSMKSRVYNELY